MTKPLKQYHLSADLAQFPVSQEETLAQLVERIGWTAFVDRLIAIEYPAFPEYKLETERSHRAKGVRGNQNWKGKT